MIGWLADSLYSGVIGIWWHIYGLPWPTGHDWFRWFLFLVAGKIVWWFIGWQFSKKYSIRTSENGAAAIVSSLFDRH